MHVNDFLNNEDIKKNYYEKLTKSRPEFLQMVYDSYAAFDFQKLSNYKKQLNDPISKQSIQVQREEADPKGVQRNMELFLKGLELEKWQKEIANLNIKIENRNIQNKGAVKRTSISLSNLEIKQFDFLKPYMIPKTPPKKMSADNQTFNFKTKGTKIISFAKSSLINQEKIKNYINVIFNNGDDEKLLKLIDTSKDNKIVFIEKISHKFENGDIFIDEEVDWASLERRAEILANSRFRFVEKVEILVCKFIISVKKLYKKKKEREKIQALQVSNPVHPSANNNEGSKSHFDPKQSYSSSSHTLKGTDKFKPVKEYISSRDINELIRDLKLKNSKLTKEEGIKKFKNILATKVKEKEQSITKLKLLSIKEKVKVLLESNYKPDEYQNNEESQYEYVNNEQGKKKKNIQKPTLDEFLCSQQEERKPAPGSTGKPSYREKKRVSIKEDGEINVKEDNRLLPKKIVDIDGMKAFIKEEMKK